jgi:hypothetical protein
MRTCSTVFVGTAVLFLHVHISWPRASVGAIDGGNGIRRQSHIAGLLGDANGKESRQEGQEDRQENRQEEKVTRKSGN